MIVASRQSSLDGYFSEWKRVISSTESLRNSASVRFSSSVISFFDASKAEISASFRSIDDVLAVLILNLQTFDESH